MKRKLGALAGLLLGLALFIGAPGAGSRVRTRLTTKNSSTTTTHVCNTGTGGDDMDQDGDTISLAGPTVLWPPNHKYVTEQVTATDVDGAVESVADSDGVMLMTTATSNQPAGGLGSGNTKDDATVNAPTNGSESATQTVKLRAERDGVDPTKAGRNYTITAMATFDNNMVETCTATFTVHVPHDQGH